MSEIASGAAAASVDSAASATADMSPHAVGSPWSHIAGPVAILLHDIAHSSALRHLVCGAVAGGVAKTVTAPMDRLKILIQVSTVPFSFGGAGRTVLNVISSEGAFGLWRGHGATLLRILPYAGLHYASHEAIEDGFRWRQGLPHGAPLGPAERFVAGAVAGGAATLATYPLDVVRARMAVAGPGARLSKATLDVLRAGPAVSFRGVLPTLLGIMPYSGMAWLTYQSLSDTLAELRHTREVAAGTASATASVRPTPGEKLSAGAVAGLVGQSATYPLDIARRRMQVGGEMGAGGMLAVLRRVVQQEGPAALFKGLSLNWFKGPVATSVSFLAFDFMNSHLKLLSAEHKRLTSGECLESSSAAAATAPGADDGDE